MNFTVAVWTNNILTHLGVWTEGEDQDGPDTDDNCPSVVHSDESYSTFMDLDNENSFLLRKALGSSSRHNELRKEIRKLGYPTDEDLENTDLDFEDSNVEESIELNVNDAKNGHSGPAKGPVKGVGYARS